MKRILVLAFIGLSAWSQAQIGTTESRIKILEVHSDTLRIDSVSISPYYLEVYDEQGNEIDPSTYRVDPAKGLFMPAEGFLHRGSIIEIRYDRLPDFMTKSYQAFDPDLIVPQATSDAQVYSSRTNRGNTREKPFEGLSTRGSLSRGVTIGSNQDAVVNSNFNLQIEGRLSEKVGIRASITDNEIPLQSGGFTQRLDEFDQVFIEMFSDKWSLRAGDLDLINRKNYFMRFQKKVSGIMVNALPGKNTGQAEIFASGAIVRGKFNSYKFAGQDGNQGPYRIEGPENQQFVIMISGSERVYANGVLLKRGENFDYTIDYNTAEITFTSLYTVTSNLRFTIEYQLAERNYTRLMTYDGVKFNKKDWHASVQYYNEGDLKNSPLDQDLSDEQKEILAEAGNDTDKMIAPSEVPAEYDENRVLYKKEENGGKEIYVYSNNPDEELYQVGFSFVGENNGDYFIETTLAAGRVYAYVDPVNGIPQGSYMPVIQLVAPEKYQMINFAGGYHPNDKTDVAAELAISDRDLNLYSEIDDDTNQGFAGKLDYNQRILDRTWKLNGTIGIEYLSDNFSTIERIRNVEFVRDWNIDLLDIEQGQKQQIFKGGLVFANDSLGAFSYGFDELQIGEDYRGSKHRLFGSFENKGTSLFLNGSLMRSEEGVDINSFDRLYTRVTQRISKFWIGAKLNYENSLGQNTSTRQLNDLSHRFFELEGFGGIGDSTRVFAEVGYNYRDTDSIVSNDLARVNSAHTYFLKSRLVKSAASDLSLFVNYRQVNNELREDESNVNGRLNYRQKMLQDFVQLQTLLETRSGSLPQQEFTYVEVEPGKGFYEWIDFNENGVQELDEFVVARFPDQAIYVRVLLPTVNFIRTNQNKWSQSLRLDASGWKNRDGFKRFVSHFSNQTYFLIDARTTREGDGFTWAPFGYDEEDLLGLDQNFKNSLFFNRGMQRFSFVYTYLNSRKKTIYTFGDQNNQVSSHQFQFIHKLGSFWLLEAEAGTSVNESSSVVFSNRNYDLNTANIRPKISYLYNKNTRLEVFYTYKNKENKIEEMETLILHNLGANFRYANSQKFSLNSNVNFIYNDFQGDTNSPVAYQMLEGLQPGTNYTWVLGLQKRLTSFLDLNLNYLGRKSQGADTIHTGTMQLRATF